MIADRRHETGAVFLDRDGTLIQDPPPGFIKSPEQVRLIPGVSEGLAAMSRAGWPLVVISNQSGIARGYYEAAAFYATMDRLHFLLEQSGIRLLAAYFCPHHPDVTGPCPCRKPEPRLYQRAARDYGIDLARSWYIGNRMSDAEPALRFGGHGILITGEGHAADAVRAGAAGVRVAPDLVAAARIVGAP